MRAQDTPRRRRGERLSLRHEPRRRSRDGKTLLDKVWDAHTVRELPSGQTQLFIGLHLIHEVTSPQAFAMLRERGLPVLFPERTFATVDHIIPTDSQARPLARRARRGDDAALERNCARARHPLLRPRRAASRASCT